MQFCGAGVCLCVLISFISSSALHLWKMSPALSVWHTSGCNVVASADGGFPDHVSHHDKKFGQCELLQLGADA